MFPISKINVLFWHIVLWIADWITFHKFGITGQYLSQYICLLDKTREHRRDPIIKKILLEGGGGDHPRATPQAFGQWLFSHKQLIFCVPPQKSKLRPWMRDIFQYKNIAYIHTNTDKPLTDRHTTHYDYIVSH